MLPHAYRGDQALSVSSVFTCLATIVVILRLYTRLFVIRCTGIEDYFVSLAMLCSIGLTICIGIQVDYGMGRHLQEVPGHELRKSLKAFWGSLIFYYLSLGLTKSSILLQYRRVFPTRRFQIACWLTMILVIVYTIWAVSGSIFACYPIRAFWTHEEPAKCINQSAMWFTNAGVNILTDFIIILLPMPVVRSLNLGQRQKQVLIIVFGIGGFGCIVSILRLHSLVAISNSTDPTYDNPPAATWSSVEIDVAIICSCLPCLRPLLARYFPGIFSSHHRSRASAIPSAHGRQIAHEGTQLGRIDTKYSPGSSDAENRDDRIQVVTEVRVSVESKDDGRSGNNSLVKEVRIEPGSSTETLVRDVTKVV
ncbi:hypothetical protein K505DRAFT_282840 [Melanomma pulvis-pyrius CBS 109.77]|uniref:Rhodopsin domain-containing protein n=1 Tax=Melanomma pulvis-pyrius CBS 109.77 TaxID=1314802 RepID=A0A6A6X1S9_9PLEO|nr:hypothetical protein K505DRAFT_282840 [Melanomma pulvis-pyrius CBS 109.77]